MITDFTVLKNESTDRISDHYPILLTLETASHATSVSAPAEEKEVEVIPQSTDAESQHPDIDAVLKLLERPSDVVQQPTDQPPAAPPLPTRKENTDDEGTLIIKHDDD